MYASLRSVGASYRLGTGSALLRPADFAALGRFAPPATSATASSPSTFPFGDRVVASFHTSALAFGGRHTTTQPERVLEWKKRISKKAQKRYKKQKERNKEQAKKRQAAAAAGQAGAGGQQTALISAPEVLPALPSPAELASISAQNRVVLESFLTPALSPDGSTAAATAEDGSRRTSGSSLLASSSYDPSAGPLNAEEADTLLAALKAGKVPRDAETAQLLMKTFAAQGRFEDCLALFSAMRRDWGLSPDTGHYNSLLLSLAQQRNKEGALAVFDSMAASEVAVSEVTFGALMQACLRAGDLTAAFEQLRAAERSGIDVGRSPVLFTHLIVGCIQAGQYDRAWLCFDHAREKHGLQPDSVLYAAMITACAKTDQVEKAIGLLTEMKQSSVPMTSVVYNAAIHAAGRSFRKASVAHSLFSEMVAEGFRPDDRTYTSMMLACSHTGDVTRARMYLYQYLKENNAAKPSLFTLNALLACYMRALRPLEKNQERDEDAKALALNEEKAKELLLLETPDDAAELLAGRKRELGEYARIVEGDPNQLAENLLADYFSADSGSTSSPGGGMLRKGKMSAGRAAKAAEAAAAAEEAAESGTQASLIAAEREALDADPLVPANPADELLPKVETYNQDLATSEYQQAKALLIKEIGVDPALFEKLEADNARPIPIDSDEDLTRQEVEAREDRASRLKDAARAIETLQKDSQLAIKTAKVEEQAVSLAEKLGLDLSNTALARSLARKAAQAAAIRTDGVLAVDGLDGNVGGGADTSGGAADGLPPSDASLDSVLKELAADALAGRTLFDDVMMGVKLKMGMDPLANPFDITKSPALTDALAGKGKGDGALSSDDAEEKASGGVGRRRRSSRLRAAAAAARSAAASQASSSSTALATTTSAPDPIVVPSTNPHGTTAGIIESFLPTPSAVPDPETGGKTPKLRFKDYLKSLEKAVEAQVFAEAGPLAPSNIAAKQMSQAANKAAELLASTSTSSSASMGSGPSALTVTTATGGRKGKMTVQEARAILAKHNASSRRLSLFDSSDEEGDGGVDIAGTSLNKLLDIRDIPLPETSDAEGEHDPIKLHDYFAEKTARRVMEALEKEEALIAEAEEVVRRANGLLTEGELQKVQAISANAGLGTAFALEAGRDVPVGGGLDGGAQSEWSNSDWSDVEAGRADDLSRTQSRSRRQLPAAASAAPPAIEAGQRVLAAADGTNPQQPLASALPFTVNPLPDGTASEMAAAAELLRPLAPQKPALPPQLSYAAVDDAGNVLLERVAVTTTTRTSGIGVIGSSPEGSAIGTAAEKPPGLVRRRRSGTPLSPTAFMPRPANFAPSIATDLPPLPEEQAALAATTSASASASTSAGEASETASAVESAAEQTLSSEAAAATTTTTTPPASTTAARTRVPLSAAVMQTVSSFLSPDSASAFQPAPSLSSDSAPRKNPVGIVAADSVLPASADSALLTVAEQHQELVLSARKEVASLLLPAPAETGSELFAHLDPRKVGQPRKDEIEAAAVEDEFKDLSPEQYNHPLVERKRVIRRAMAKMLRTEVLPRLERALVLAAEDVRKYRKRRATGSQPNTMDALFAVQTLKDKAEALRAANAEAEDAFFASEAHEEPATASSTSAAAAAAATAPSAANSLALPRPVDPLAIDLAAVPDDQLSRGQKRHLARQDAALQVASALTSPTGTKDSRGETRMKALVQMSDRLLSGAHWLPMGGAVGSISRPGSFTSPQAYPEDRELRKAVLLEEAENIYLVELQENCGYKPDIVTLNTMLGAYCTAGMNSKAYAFLKQEFAVHGVRPDARTFRALVALHVRQRNGDKAEKVFAVMREQGIEPDKDTYGSMVHLRAREWRIKDSIELLKEMKAKGIHCSEHYAFLVRQRCKELNIYHAAVPAHPVGWQFTPEVMAKRRSQSSMAGKLSKFLRPKIGKYS